MPLREIILRLFLSILIGGIIGYEREYTNSPAGFRTHILVSVGATIISLIQVQMVGDSISLIGNNPNLANSIKIDMGRLGAQVISGIGFLGAGSILHTKGSIKGLTTAASIWVVGCVGLAIGLGYYAISVLGCIAIVLVLVTLKRFEQKFISNSGIHKICIQYTEKSEVMKFIEGYINGKAIKIKNLEFYMNDLDENSHEKNETCLLTLKVPKSLDVNELLIQWSINDSIVKVYEIKE